MNKAKSVSNSNSVNNSNNSSNNANNNNSNNNSDHDNSDSECSDSANGNNKNGKNTIDWDTDSEMKHRILDLIANIEHQMQYIIFRNNGLNNLNSNNNPNNRDNTHSRNDELYNGDLCSNELEDGTGAGAGHDINDNFDFLVNPGLYDLDYMIMIIILTIIMIIVIRMAD